MEFITDVVCLSVSSILDKHPDLGESETVPKDSTGQGGTQKRVLSSLSHGAVSSSLQFNMCKLCSSLLEGIRGKVKEKNIKSYSSISAVDGSHLSCPSLALFLGRKESLGRERNQRSNAVGTLWCRR